MSGTLAGALLHLAGLRLADHPSAIAYQAVTDVAVSLVPPAEVVVLTLGSSAEPAAVAHVGAPDGYPIDELLAPAREAIRRGGVVHAGGDLTLWPALRRGPGQVCDIIAQPLHLGPRRTGVLVYAGVKQALTGADLALVEALGGPVSVVVANATEFDALRRDNEQLIEGLRSRETIGLAKGILMRQETCSETEAFQILAAASQRVNRKVRDVARDLIALTEGRAELMRGTGD